MAPLTEPAWRPRWAAHLGISSPDTPLFAASARSPDPQDQIDYVAVRGFAGVTDNGLRLRDPETQERMGAALAQHDMVMGTFTVSPPGWPPFLWTDRDAPVASVMTEAIAAARRVGGGTLNVILCDSGADRVTQIAAARDSLCRAADMAGAAGLAIGLEPANRARVPQVLVEHAAEAAEIVIRLAHPALGLVLDSCHLHLGGEDMATAIRDYAACLVTVQIADMPGRVEPGAGMLDLHATMAALAAIGWDGLIEAECFPSSAGAAGEAAVLEGLHRLWGTAGDGTLPKPTGLVYGSSKTRDCGFRQG